MLYSFKKSIKLDIHATHREIATFFVELTNSRNRMVATMSSLLKVSKRTLFKYTKFRVQIDENGEVACWALICRQHYRCKMAEGIKDKVIEFWDTHSRAIPDRRHVLQKRLSRNVYREHCKHVMEMTTVALYEEFQETNPGVQIAFSMFNKLKPWYIKPNTIRDTCCCRYHVEFQLYYGTFLDFCRRH